MYEFTDRLITMPLPRVREFQGVKNCNAVEEIILWELLSR